MQSDLTYDEPCVWDGRFFRIDDHIIRLESSCKTLRLKLPLPREEVKTTLVEMVAKGGIRDASVEIIVTRWLKGVRGSRPDELLNNSLYMFFQPYVWVMEPEMQPVAGKATVARAVCRIPPGSIDPPVMNLQWGDIVRGLFDGIMPTTELDGNLVKDGKLGPITKDIWDGYCAIYYDPKFIFEIDFKNGTAVNGVCQNG
ncbi:hypothetical protein N8I77_007555 [Diaporthe amygdali]|uniref:Uncharacterized protein n=1 Tax=Phomopsis amygdali TaxID=1214568 RepID=A0AAD9W3J7_PHOAM|nr:hypothetical protein N8I77_007555 [Diaporthe amygdali]